MEETCDMHMHTFHSDGQKNDLELLQECLDRKLKYISITDHDCVDFYLNDQAKDFAEANGISIIVGCEFVCKVNNQPIEILGYGLDINKVKEYLDKHGVNQNKLEKYRSETVPEIFKNLGVLLDYDATKVDFSLSNPEVYHKLVQSIKRNERAIELVESEIPNFLTRKDSALLREGLNNKKSKFYINIEKIFPNCNTIIDKIHEFGGIASLAHPYEYGENVFTVLESVKNFNIDGVECYHHTSIDLTNNDVSKRDFLINYCSKNGLLITGGSDYHGPSRPDRNLLNKLNIPVSVFYNIKQKISLQRMKNISKQDITLSQNRVADSK